MTPITPSRCRNCAAPCWWPHSRAGTMRARPPQVRSSTSSCSGMPSRPCEITPDDYYDFQVSRPTVHLIDGVSRRLEWPTTTFSYCSPPGADHDLVLVKGIEPNFRWRAFVAEIAEIAEIAGVTSAVMLGSMMADVPTRAPCRSPVRRTAVRRPSSTGLPSRGTRDRRGSPACCRTASSPLGSRRCRSGPPSRTTFRPHRIQRRHWHCCADSKTSSTSRSRWTNCPSARRRGAHRRRDDLRRRGYGLSTSASSRRTTMRRRRIRRRCRRSTVSSSPQISSAYLRRRNPDAGGFRPSGPRGGRVSRSARWTRPAS